MLCRELSPKSLRRPLLIRGTKAVLGAAVFLTVTGCGGHFGNLDTSETPAQTTQGGGSQVLAMLLGFKRDDAPAAPGTSARHIFCPEVLVLEGTAASQAYAGTPPSSANLRHQFALTETARECSLEGDQLAIKIGVAGKVLLGPAGSPGSFNVPVRMAVLSERNNEPITSKLYHALVTVPAGGSQADFTLVSDPLRVPFIQDHAEDDYTIKVGIDEGPGNNTEKPAGKTGKR
jgi:hypothetical protein